MQTTLTQPAEEITSTTIKVPTEEWLEFRGVMTRRAKTVNEAILEAIRLWLASQPN